MAQHIGPNTVTDGLVFCLDAADKNSYYPVTNFVSAKVYSVYNGGLRSANYTVQYSDDNSNWSTAFSGVCSNDPYASCGIKNCTGSGDGSYGAHRYWRYVEGSAVAGHHPRVSRIILTDVQGVNHDFKVYAADNCSDSGVHAPGTVSVDYRSRWHDLSGNGFNATLSAAAIGTDVPGVMDFNGSDEYIQIIDGPGTGPWTCDENRSISVWIKPDTDKHQHIISGDDDTGWHHNTVMYTTPTQIGVYHCVNGVYGSVKKTVDYTNGGWHHVVLTLDQTLSSSTSFELSLYHNGYLDDQTTVAGITNVSSEWDEIAIGRYHIMETASDPMQDGTHGTLTGYDADPQTTTFDGKISTVRFYNRVLSAKEISQNFNAQRSRFGV